MTWTKDMPQKEGRYFFRNTGDYSYGVCLVAWDKGLAWDNHVEQPHLEVKAICNFGRSHPETWRNEGTGENTDYPGWSYPGGYGKKNVAQMLFWSEPIEPVDFPPISGRPPDISAEKIAEVQTEAAKKIKKGKATARKEAKRRKKVIQTAVDEGVNLYQCDDCENTWAEDELIKGKLRECPHCSITFVETDGSICPDCNRPFTRLEEEKPTCPNCFDDGELPDLTLLVEKGVRK